jgi:hypothetical protein
LDVCDLVNGIRKLVLKELGVLLGIVVGIKSLGFNGQEVSDSGFAVRLLSLVAGVRIALLIDDARAEIIDQIQHGVEDSGCGGL